MRLCSTKSVFFGRVGMGRVEVLNFPISGIFISGSGNYDNVLLVISITSLNRGKICSLIGKIKIR